MSQFLTFDYLIAFLFSVIRMSTPIIFCALGGAYRQPCRGHQYGPGGHYADRFAAGGYV